MYFCLSCDEKNLENHSISSVLLLVRVSLQKERIGRMVVPEGTGKVKYTVKGVKREY